MNARSKAIVWIVVVLLLGAAIGSLTTLLVEYRTTATSEQSRPQRFSSRPHFRDTEAVAQRIFRELSTELELDAEQQARLTEVLKETGKKLKAASERSWAEFSAIREASSVEIRTFLRPDQVEKFNELIKKKRERDRIKRSQGDTAD